MAAAYYFRDEVQKAFGIDIVEIFKGAANYVINSFQAAFDDVVFIWKNFPDIMTVAATGAGNALIDGIEGALNIIVPKIKDFYRLLNPLAALADATGNDFISKALGTGLLPNDFSFGDIDDGGAGARLSAANDNHAQRTAATMSRDVIGDWSAGFKGSAAEVFKLDQAVTALAANTGRADKAAAKAAKAYKDIVNDAQAFIQSQNDEAAALGMTARQAAALRYEHELLDEARNRGIKLTPTQTEHLKMLAGAMADAETRAKSLKQAFDFVSDVGKGFFTDFANNLQQGMGLWESFAAAGIAALQKLADKLIEMALNALIQQLFGNLLGTFGLGALGSPGFQQTGSWAAANAGFAEGGWTGPGGKHDIKGAVHADEFVFSKAAVQRAGVRNLDRLHSMMKGGFNEAAFMPRMQAAGNQNSYNFAPTFNIDASNAERGVGEEIDAKIKAASKQMMDQIRAEFPKNVADAMPVIRTMGWG